MEKASINGLMVIHLLDAFTKASNMARVNGDSNPQILMSPKNSTNLRVNIIKIKSMG